VAYNFQPLNREQMYLMPPSLRDWLPEDDLAWFIIDVVNQMDLSKFYGKYRQDGWGRAAYEPSMMVSLLLYAYCLGERSSRRIEWLCHRDIAFRVITANQVPDHSTIARFRQDNERELEELFVQVLRLCAEAGLVKVGMVTLDGTKLAANASLDANRTYATIEEEVKRILSEAKAKDEEETRVRGAGQRGDELPEDLRDPRSRLARLRECKARLEREAQEAALAQEAKISARQAEEEETGKKKRGRKPKDPDPTPDREAKANVTDPDSRIMKTRLGYKQAYNAQAVVCETQVIVAADLTQDANDCQQLHPMVRQAQENLDAAQVDQRMGALAADAGYWSEANCAGSNPDGPELFVATTKDWKQRKAAREQPPPRGRIPGHLGPRERMERKLLTKRGRRIYKKRSQLVEPVFGQIKEVRGCGGFMRRGYSACRSEWRVICATHNLLKLWRHFLAEARGLFCPQRTKPALAA